MRNEAEHYQCLTQESVSGSDGSNRSGWVRLMMLLASIVTVGNVLVQYTEEAPLLRVGVVPAPLTDTPPAFHSREKCFMILKPNFIYLAIFLIFQIWLSSQ